MPTKMLPLEHHCQNDQNTRDKWYALGVKKQYDSRVELGKARQRKSRRWQRAVPGELEIRNE